MESELWKVFSDISPFLAHHLMTALDGQILNLAFSLRSQARHCMFECKKLGSALQPCLGLAAQTAPVSQGEVEFVERSCFISCSISKSHPFCSLGFQSRQSHRIIS